MFITLGTVRDGKAVEATLAKYFPDIHYRFYYADADDAVKADFNDIKRVWSDERIRLVMATSTLMCGVDFSVNIERGELACFDVLFEMQTYNAISPREYDQMSHRVRQFSEKVCHTYITTPYSDAAGPV